MAVDFTIWWGRQDMPAGHGGTAPALMLAESTGSSVVETLVDCSTSKPSAAAPALGGGNLVPFIAVASGGSIWARAGAAPTAVAKSAGAMLFPEGVPISGYMRVGDKLAAIAAA